MFLKLMLIGTLSIAGTVAAQHLPSLPIAPVASSGADTPASAPAEELTLADLDRLVAAERERLAGIAEPTHRAASPATTVPDLPPPELDVSVGKTVSLGLGLQQVSRIQTPFAELRIQHQSTASIKKQGGVVYISPVDTTPFVIYLEDRRDPSRSVGLLLRPHVALPPVQVRLNLPGVSQATPIVATEPASAGHQARIRSVLRAIVLEQVPAGFSQAPIQDQDPLIDCQIPGLQVEPLAAWHGTDMSVLTARVDNVSAGVIAIDESACANDQVLAVAAYPDTELWPGNSTELLVVFHGGSPRPGAAADRSEVGHD